MRSAVYDQAVQHWRRSDGREGFAPVPMDVDEGLLAIRIGQVLGVPALDVASLPAQWVRNALISMRTESLHHTRAMKAAETRRKKSSKATARRS